MESTSVGGRLPALLLPASAGGAAVVAIRPAGRLATVLVVAHAGCVPCTAFIEALRS
ncbi:MAG: hypothetical protein WEF86_05275 [Gemmatimonadota bacterium]